MFCYLKQLLQRKWLILHMIYAEADRLRFSVSHAPLIANIKWWYEKQIYLSNGYGKNGDECFFACFKNFDPSIVWEGNTYANSEIS